VNPRPQTDSIVERFNPGLGEHLSGMRKTAPPTTAPLSRHAERDFYFLAFVAD
jgi:hypothetical protein